MQRGRPSTKQAVQENVAPVETPVVNQLPARRRNKRQSFGHRSKLYLPEIPGYYARWFNDEPGRIAQKQDEDYTFVTHEEAQREKREGEDSRVRELVGSKKDGTALYAYAMKIPMEYHLEDKSDYNAKLDNIDNAIRGGKYDKVDQSYVPPGGIKYQT